MVSNISRYKTKVNERVIQWINVLSLSPTLIYMWNLCSLRLDNCFFVKKLYMCPKNTNIYYIKHLRHKIKRQISILIGC